MRLTFPTPAIGTMDIHMFLRIEVVRTTSPKYCSKQYYSIILCGTKDITGADYSRILFIEPKTCVQVFNTVTQLPVADVYLLVAKAAAAVAAAAAGWAMKQLSHARI